MLRCIIVEDEPLALERTRAYVQKLPWLQLAAAFDNARDARTFLEKHPVDIIFLDISLGGMTGIQLLEAINITSEVIITSAYNEYALKGFELNVTDYLLKPFTFERFSQAAERARHNITRDEAPGARRFIFVKTEYRLEKLPLSEVLYIEGMRDYRRIHTATRRIMTLQTFRDFEQEIPPAIICRVHKSYMVALDKIDVVERDRIRIRETIIPVSESYRKAFFELINRGKAQ